MLPLFPPTQVFRTSRSRPSSTGTAERLGVRWGSVETLGVPAEISPLKPRSGLAPRWRFPLAPPMSRRSPLAPSPVVHAQHVHRGTGHGVAGTHTREQRRAADRFGAPGSGRRRAAVRQRSGADMRAPRTGTDESRRAEASDGRSRRRRRGCASRRRGPAGTGCRTRDRMPWPRSSAPAASPGGYHGRSGQGFGEWTGSRSNAGRCSRTIPYRRMLLPLWRSFMAVGPYRASGSTLQNVQLRAIHAKLPRTLKSTARLKRHTSWYCNPGAAVTQNKPALPARKPSGENRRHSNSDSAAGRNS